MNHPVCIVGGPLATAVFALLGWTTISARLPADAAEPKVVIPFDFESKFDQGRYGQMLGDMIWKKLEGRGGFVIPEAMAEYAGIKDQVVLIGAGDHFEIWDRAKWQARHQKIQKTG